MRTIPKHTDGVRYAIVESVTATVAAEHLRAGGYAAIIREDYKRPASKRQGQAIFGAWAAVDQGLNRIGLAVTNEINASTVKTLIGGHGKAEKDEVAAGVRRILGLPKDYEFTNDDESDAAAIVLAWLIENDKITI